MMTLAAGAWIVTPAVAGDGAGCDGDTNGDGQVNVEDILEVVLNFGADCTKTPCAGDVDDSGMIDVHDLLTVVLNFGPCDAPICGTSADCDDGDDCTLDLCINGSCVNLALPNCP
jgi:hypothetical protein